MVAKDSLFNDYIWTIGYYLTLQMNGNLEEMFPTFLKSIINVNDESDSKVSAVFTRAFKLIHDISSTYIIDEEEQNDIQNSISEFFIDDLHENPGLKAHGAKKLGVQTLGDLLTVNITDISMRGGWALKSFNTFFDYWVGSFPASVRTGKMIAGWHQVSSCRCILLHSI